MIFRPASSGVLAARTSAVIASAAVGIWGQWWLFVTTIGGRRVDHLAMLGALHGHTTLWVYAERVLEPVSVLYGAIAFAVVVGIAVLRRRFRMAVQAALLLGGSVLTTQVLKRYVLGRPDLGDLPPLANALPSGHTTAAAAASAALLFVATPRWRPTVAVLGAAYTILTGWSTLIGQWHRPSDVMAAVLVVTAWSAAASLSMLIGSNSAPTATTVFSVVRPGPGVSGRVSMFLGGVGTVALGLTVIIGVWLWIGEVSSVRDELVAYGGGVAAIVAAVCLGVAVQLGLREAVGRVALDSQGWRKPSPLSEAVPAP